MCNVKSKTPVIVAAIFGVVLVAATWGAVFAIGSEAANQLEAAEIESAEEDYDGGGY